MTSIKRKRKNAARQMVSRSPTEMKAIKKLGVLDVHEAIPDLPDTVYILGSGPNGREHIL